MHISCHLFKPKPLTVPWRPACGLVLPSMATLNKSFSVFHCCLGDHWLAYWGQLDRPSLLEPPESEPFTLKQPVRLPQNQHRDCLAILRVEVMLKPRCWLGHVPICFWGPSILLRLNLHSSTFKLLWLTNFSAPPLSLIDLPRSTEPSSQGNWEWLKGWLLCLPLFYICLINFAYFCT